MFTGFMMGVCFTLVVSGIIAIICLVIASIVDHCRYKKVVNRSQLLDEIASVVRHELEYAKSKKKGNLNLNVRR